MTRANGTRSHPTRAQGAYLRILAHLTSSMSRNLAENRRHERPTRIRSPRGGPHGAETGNPLISSTYRRECWILCTSVAPASLTRMNSMRASVCRGYDATTLIADTSQFGKQLGIDFGNAFRTRDVERPGQAWWMLLPQVVVDHGPVVYTESPSDVIQRFPKASWGLVTPFVCQWRRHVGPLFPRPSPLPGPHWP